VALAAAAGISAARAWHNARKAAASKAAYQQNPAASASAA